MNDVSLLLPRCGGDFLWLSLGKCVSLKNLRATLVGRGVAILYHDFRNFLDML